MPFTPAFPHAFSVRSVRTYAPATSGVYGVSNAREWIFIGQTDNIQGKLLEHLSEADTPLRRRNPTGFSCEICDEWLRNMRQDRLVMEYKPVLQMSK